MTPYCVTKPQWYLQLIRVMACYLRAPSPITDTNSYVLQWRHNGRNCVSNNQTHDCLLNRLFRRRSKKTSKLRVTGLCAGNSPVTGEFPAQMAGNAENVSIWWRHHGIANKSQTNTTMHFSGNISNIYREKYLTLIIRRWLSLCSGAKVRVHLVMSQHSQKIRGLYIGGNAENIGRIFGLVLENLLNKNPLSTRKWKL